MSAICGKIFRSTDVYANLESGAKCCASAAVGDAGHRCISVVADKASGGIMIASSIHDGRALAG